MRTYVWKGSVFPRTNFTRQLPPYHKICHVLVNDMQTSPPPSKRAVSIFLSKLLHNVLKQMKNQYFHFCDFYFLSYDRSLHNFQVFSPTKNGEKMFQKMCNILKRIFEFTSFFCVIFSFSYTVDFLFNSVKLWIRDLWFLRTWFRR